MKKIKIVTFIIIIVLILASCNTNNLEEYKNAIKKTDKIKKGQASAEFSLIVDLNSDGMTAEEIKGFDYIKDMKGNFNIIYDEDEEKYIYRNYLNFGGLGFDFDVYTNKDEVIVKLPIVGKYMNLDQIKNSVDLDYEVANKDILSEETKEEIMNTWLGLMNKEDVFKGHDIILTTPDGEVKTTEYSITLSDEQIKTLSYKCIEILSKDTNLIELYDKYIKTNLDNKDYVSFEELINNIKDNINIYNVEKFNYTALVDIDGYIVSEKIVFSINIADSKSIFENVTYNLDIKNWNINKKQNFDFPVTTQENMYNIDDFNKNMPNIINNFSNKGK